MAARRDELNAYTFARKRTVAAFLKPMPNGSLESVPRPLRSVLPSIVLGTLILVGFGACGMIKPTAPPGWNNPGEKLIVGGGSTTSYVVLESTELEGNGDEKTTKLLHPVLNLASAKLLLDPDKFEIVKVDESAIDNSGIAMGPTIGIPYAPDRLPDEKAAKEKKVWALCERPGGGVNSGSQKAVFVLGGEKDQARVAGRNKLSESEAVFVEAPGGARYLVDHRGTAYPIARTATQQAPQEVQDALRSALFGQDARPQRVSADWMGTLNPGSPLVFPEPEGAGTPSSAAGVPPEHNTIGTVLKADDADGTQQYVVLADRLAPVSDFTARLLLQGPNALKAYKGDVPEAVKVAAPSIRPSGDDYMAEMHWPDKDPTQVNENSDAGDRQVSCSVYHGHDNQLTKLPEMTMWAGTDYPAPIADGGTSAYVTPGSGLLFRQVSGGSGSNVGSVFLVTDTGLRYSVPANNDSDKAAGDAEKEVNQSQVRLGYGAVEPVPVPKAWSQLLAAGPTLDTTSAKQPQGS